MLLVLHRLWRAQALTQAGEPLPNPCRTVCRFPPTVETCGAMLPAWAQLKGSRLMCHASVALRAAVPELQGVRSDLSIPKGGTVRACNPASEPCPCLGVRVEQRQRFHASKG